VQRGRSPKSQPQLRKQPLQLNAAKHEFTDTDTDTACVPAPPFTWLLWLLPPLLPALSHPPLPSPC
jgi:hypothetical protein